MIIDWVQTIALVIIIIIVIAHQAALDRLSRRIRRLSDIVTGGGRPTARLLDGRWDDADEDEDGDDGEEDEWHD